MRNTKNSAFTLVELIVVITILAILGTIAFISLQGYSADSRDSKRVSDVSSIAKKISIKMADASSKTSEDFLETTDATQAADNVTVNSGTTVTYLAWYDAGSINFTELEENSADFQDASGKDGYAYGYVYTGGINYFQVAASLEGTDGVKVVGNYFQKNSGTDSAGLIDSTNAGDFVVSGTATNQPYSLTD